VRRLACAMAAAGLLTGPSARAGGPQLREVALAAIETESAVPDASGAEPAEGASPTVEPSRTGNPLWVVPISKLSATRDRPLFSVSRRPPTPAAPAAPTPTSTVASPAPAPETPPFTLVGTIVGGDSRIAIFYDETSKIASGVRAGERASGWTLRSVDPRSATLEESGRIVTLALPEPPGEIGSPPPAVSASPTRGKRHRLNSDGLY
jgi:general secretion pathway protein N